MSDNIYKVNRNLPIADKIKLINDMVLNNEGEIANAKFDENEITNLYTQTAMDRKYLRNVALGNTLTDYTDWTHYIAENGYSIWKLTPDNYAYNAVNNLYVDGAELTNKGEANSLSSTFDVAKIFLTTYTDNTTEAGTEGGTAFSLMTALTTAWATPENELYIGLDTTFSGAKFEFSTRGANYTLRIGYYSSESGVGWKELEANADGLVDGTSAFTSDGLISWTIPDDWTTNAIDGDTKYWIRIDTSTTPSVTATCNYLIPGTSVQGLLALSATEIRKADWKWCSYSDDIYVTIRNIGTDAYEGNYFITSASTAANLQNYFVYNHDFTIDHEDSTYVAAAEGITQSETGVTNFDIVIVNGLITSFTKN